MKVWTLLIISFNGLVSAGSAFVSNSCAGDGRRRNKAEAKIKSFGVARLTHRSLFFKEKAEESLKAKRQAAQARIPNDALTELGQETLQLPFQLKLVEGGEDSEKTVTIRLLTAEDLGTIVPMCVVEFGSPTSFNDLFQNFPWEQPLKAQEHISDWWENFALPALIYWTFRLKIFLEDPQDHALLVATLENGSLYPDNPMNQNNDAQLVGMVELSKQPAVATRNPSAYPVPLWYKEWYCLVNKLPSPNGWVTNLLVGPEFRGQGFSKLLMTAAEGVARTWGCTAIHLHCDAGAVSGKVPQNLYRSLGYEMVEDKKAPYSWMGSDFSQKIYMIQGVALLYFRKVLDTQRG